jgi:cytochrome b subunit of formate dehydrogenase
MSTNADTVVRFSRRTRIEHASVMGLFLALAVTGFPQKFYPAPWTQAIVGVLGGIDAVRWLHRAAGVLFALLLVLHVAGSAWPTLRRREALSLVPDAKDFRDAAAMLRYQLGTAARPPAFDRFDYRQKFEYWGLVLGGSIMVATGFLLLFPLLSTAILGGQFVPAAKVAHSSEGLMAFLVVLTWHIFNAHLSPEAFPGDTTIFTGRIERERLRHEHPLEYARLSEGGTPEPLSGNPVWALLTAPVRGGLLVMYLPSLGFVMVAAHVGRRVQGWFQRRGRRPADPADESKTVDPPASAA